ncbi:hypothetical protein RGF97_00345 [Streptomyces roseicoloratus]|uniref:Uncharacterized protein n=1 Tax=Streptomyces roseicoloratus TaxID=2508722 RepID=A0ABY9RN75_9ACTN|nr:hypothetical protein [Streptomyces roseicoloratus]WMX43631.1 hypothetical protein RGF97_00345 [Streptomyces roseicoloratus]
MGFTSAWGVSAHPDAVIADVATRLLPAMEADRTAPGARERWAAWQRAPLPDHRTWYAVGSRGTEEWEAIEAFRDMTAPGGHVDPLCDGVSDPDFYVVDDVWVGQDLEHLFVSVHSKEYAVASLFHAIGPERAALLPGWCGNFLLTAAEAREALPRVEAAFAFTRAERVAAQERDWLSYGADEESVLDGPARVWRNAVRDGLGLCGVALHLT